MPAPPPPTLALSAPDLARLRREAEAAYPREACAILVGIAAGAGPEGGEGAAGEAGAAGGSGPGPLPARGLEVRRVEPCENAAEGDRRRRYAIAPEALLRAVRTARARGEAVVGFWHSHPDAPPRPSPTDLADAHWPGCAYAITAVPGGRAGETRAFLLLPGDGGGEAGKRFVELPVAAAAATAGAGGGAPPSP